MKGKDTEDKIYREAYKLFVSKPYELVTVRDLEHAINMTRGAIFHYVKDKEQLFREVNVFIMKMKFLFGIMIVAALTACNNGDDANVPSNEEAATGGLSVMATKAASYAGTSGKTVIFTGDDIKSFNRVTGELSLIDGFSFTAVRAKTENTTLTFYLGDKELFKSATFAYDTTLILENKVINDLTFILRGDLDSLIFLMDGFPALDEVAKYGVPEARASAEREENATKRKAEWDLFLKYLEEADKLVEKYSSGKPGNSIPDDTLNITSPSINDPKNGSADDFKDIGYIVDYAGCEGYSHIGYYIITENEEDTLVTYNLPDNVYPFPQSFYDNPEPYRNTYKIAFTYRLADDDEKKGVVCPAMYQPHRLYWNKESSGEEKEIIIISAEGWQ
jgi:hypothetical protein